MRTFILTVAAAASALVVASPAAAQVYGQAYGAPAYGNAYGSSYGAPYGNAYGSSYANAYGSSYGAPYGNAYGSSYANAYGSSYGAPYGNAYGYNRNGTVNQWQQQLQQIRYQADNLGRQGRLTRAEAFDLNRDLRSAETTIYHSQRNGLQGYEARAIQNKIARIRYELRVYSDRDGRRYNDRRYRRY